MPLHCSICCVTKTETQISKCVQVSYRCYSTYFRDPRVHPRLRGKQRLEGCPYIWLWWELRSAASTVWWQGSSFCPRPSGGPGSCPCSCRRSANSRSTGSHRQVSTWTKTEQGERPVRKANLQTTFACHSNHISTTPNTAGDGNAICNVIQCYLYLLQQLKLIQ